MMQAAAHAGERWQTMMVVAGFGLLAIYTFFQNMVRIHPITIVRLPYARTSTHGHRVDCPL